MSKSINKTAVPRFDPNPIEAQYAILLEATKLAQERGVRNPEQILPIAIASAIQDVFPEHLNNNCVECSGLTPSQHVYFDYTVVRERKPWLATITVEFPENSPMAYGPLSDAIIELATGCDLDNLNETRTGIPSSISKSSTKAKSLTFGLKQGELYQAIYDCIREKKQSDTEP